MSGFSHVIAATDLSAPAHQAVERAALVSRDIAASLELLHVVNPALLARLGHFLSAASAATLPQRVLDEASGRLEALARQLQAHHSAVTPMCRIVEGDLLAELLDATGEREDSLLVCGATGKSSVRHVLLGSTAERLLNRTTCPVLVVKRPAIDAYRRVLVTVDFSIASLQAIHHARAIAPQAGLTLLHVVDVPFEGLLRLTDADDEDIGHYRIIAKREATERLQALSVQAGLAASTRLVVTRGEPIESILKQARECNLVVMGKHGESRFHKWFVGKVTRQVLNASRHDVLVSV
ncbi:universal stress protein [Modicisalibacter xianhensis]|uniref:Nucleotide-binding universal stress protein, UspA family n=1 Tax=Modicisalibacter xianhensis TaxID=442341 RepID=A0A1I3DMS3_9GAMM|nr:universal stress protein [Halomonas xianhensis]SFH87791.1 Nucleotide-binding universal stress protein, UspA family [Halomonas xianhensis]